MNVIELTPPPVQPVTLAEVYAHLRLTPSGSPLEHPDDDMLETFIQTATEEVTGITHRSFVERRLLLVTSGVPCDRVVPLLFPPVVSVLSVSYYDSANVLQTVDSANYFVTDDQVPQLQFVDTYGFPSTYRSRDALRIEYMAGYEPVGSPGDYLENIPARVKSAVLLGVQLLYDQLSPEQRERIERARDSLLTPLKMYGVA
jgi:uncharacterized phiE125 gp8 family phage protein